MASISKDHVELNVATADKLASNGVTTSQAVSNGKEAENNSKPTDGPSSGSSPTKKEADNLNVAMQHLASGKRHLLVQDPNAAVTSLATACEQLVQHYGEMAVECGEVYFYYGRSLLELARLEAGVIDNVLDGVPSEDEDGGESSLVEDPEKCTDQEKVDIGEKVDKALEENFQLLESMKKEKMSTEAAKEAANNSDNKENDGKKANLADVSNDSVAVKASESVDVQQASSATTKDSTPSVSSESKPVVSESTTNEGVVTDVQDKIPQESGGLKDETSENSEEEEEGAEEQEEQDEGNEDEKAKDESAENESIGSDDNATAATKDAGDASAVQKEEEEDPSNLQLAWEMLEMAKTVLLRHSESLAKKTVDEETKKEKEDVDTRLGDTFQTLGELSIENENYPQAIEDLNTCLGMRKKMMPEDSRSIAETYYQLGVAQGFNLMFTEAVTSLEGAISVLEKRVENLKTKTESVDPAKKNDAFYSRDLEVKEIESLVPEIREKIADTLDMKQETLKKLGDRSLRDDAVQDIQSKSDSTNNSNGAGVSSPKVASSINHLIKKRKKSGDDKGSNSNVISSEAKKPHLETATNGQHKEEIKSDEVSPSVKPAQV